MNDTDDGRELIDAAAAVVSSRKIGDYTVGDVGCALVTDRGNTYRGVCIDTISGMGFCAEHSAIAAMVTAGEFRIERIVAVWKEGEEVYVLSPCGRCRELIHRIDKGNLETKVYLDRNQWVRLRELLPYHEHFQKQEIT